MWRCNASRERISSWCVAGGVASAGVDVGASAHVSTATTAAAQLLRRSGSGSGLSPSLLSSTRSFLVVGARPLLTTSSRVWTRTLMSSSWSASSASSSSSSSSSSGSSASSASSSSAASTSRRPSSRSRWGRVPFLAALAGLAGVSLALAHSETMEEWLLDHAAQLHPQRLALSMRVSMDVGGGSASRSGGGGGSASSWWGSPATVFGVTMPLPVLCICAINVTVFGMWRVLPSSFMYTHFTTSLSRLRNSFSTSWYTLLTSAFSHEGGMHLLFNCVALYSASMPLCQVLSDSSFTAFYVTSAIASSVLGYGLQMGVGRLLGKTILSVPSLGASGAVIAVFAANALCFPDLSYYIMFIPIAFSASTLLTGLVLFDAIGLVRNLQKPGGLGHHAHLGGAICGAALYLTYLRHHPWIQYKQRSRAMRQLQSSRSSSNGWF